MRLEDYDIEARRRNEWEVLDLGTLLLQQNLGRILRSGLLFAVPALFVMIAVVVFGGFFWGYMFLWLMRPLYGRVTLFVLSRAVFSSHPTPREVARALPAFLSKGLWSAVLIRPWTLSRVIVEPVCLLEGLRGQALRKRAQVLLGEGSRTTVWWGAISVSLIQICLLASMAALFLGFLPEGNEPMELQSMVQNPSSLLAWFGLIGIALSFAVIEPLWVAVGFAMYLNRRSDLEGWDVELVFRRLAQRASQGVRLSGLSLVAALVWGRVSFGVQTGTAGPAPERPVDRVFAREEFSTTVTHWIQEGGTSVPNWIGGLFEIVIWVGVATFVIWILYLLARWAMGLEVPVPGEKHTTDGGALELGGLDLRPESLPKNVAVEARALWAAGQAKEALSLLYRGSLVVLRDQHGLYIEDGDTEGRCLRKVVQLEVQGLDGYFQSLTALWMGLAYGGQGVAETEFDGLALGYGDYFTGGR